MAQLPVTAILPVFNGARYIDAAVNSILAQTRKAAQIIIVNDGSTDESEQVISAVVSRVTGPSVLVLSQENGGQSSARNAAIAEATGALVAFLDQDDLWHPQHLEVLAKGFDGDSTLGWTYSDFDEIDSESKLITRQYLTSNRVPQPKSDVASFLVQDAMILPTATVARTAAVRAVGGFDSRLVGYEDDDLFLRLFRAGWQCRFEPRSLAQFRVHAQSSSARASFGESREIYFNKASAEFPDDPRLNRYYVTDLLLPRMLYASLADYAVALRLHRDQDARTIARSASRMSAKSRLSGRRRFGLAVVRHPRLCRLLLAIVRRMPRAIRPRISPAFRLN